MQDLRPDFPKTLSAQSSYQTSTPRDGSGTTKEVQVPTVRSSVKVSKKLQVLWLRPNFYNYVDVFYRTRQMADLHVLGHKPLEERRDFACDRCDRKFAQASHVSTHIRVVHLKIKQHR